MPWTRRYEEALPQRVNRWLAQAGVCSRREAEALIAAGRVTIDGARVEDAGRKIAAGQVLVLADAGEGGAAAAGGETYVVHKPVGVVSAQPEAGQVPAARLLTGEALWRGAPAGVAPPPRDASLAPAGRLDMDSRGLLLLTSDGVVAKAAIGPASALDKEYLVRVVGSLTNARLARLRHGLELDGRALKPAEVSRLGEGAFRMVLHEGRNRQIRRMCELLELRVVDLFRVRIGPLELGALPEGRWRPLLAGERAALVSASQAGPAAGPGS
ncbi:MAG: rRNA pseudouridine synthase [Caulobacteraceae bacterium]|nr:rRNA pseudouridine synthase [Caulobacter sp.]